MVEFNEREKMIIRIVSYLNHPILKNYPDDMKIQTLYGILSVTTNTFNLNMNELKDVCMAIQKEQEDAIKNAINKMGKGV